MGALRPRALHRGFERRQRLARDAGRDLGRHPGADGLLVCARARRMEPYRRSSIAFLQLFRRIAELAGVFRLWGRTRAGGGGLLGSGHGRGFLDAGKRTGVALSWIDSYPDLAAYGVRQLLCELSGLLPGER